MLQFAAAFTTFNGGIWTGKLEKLIWTRGAGRAEKMWIAAGIIVIPSVMPFWRLIF